MSSVREAGLDRDQLVGFADSYLEALVARDPGRLPLAPNVRFTENMVDLPLDKGLWRTIRGRRPGGQYFVDVEAGQVEHWAVIDQMGKDNLLSVRLRVREQKIEEIETLVVLNTGTLFNPDRIAAARPELHDVLPPDQRGSREELVGVANSYFNAIEQANGDLVPAVDECLRFENGIQTTLVTDRPPGPGMEGGKLGVRDQLNAGIFTYIERIRERRFPIVDTERGLALAHGFFDHTGDRAQRNGNIPLGYPCSLQMTEVFKVRGGRLHEIWALGRMHTYGVVSGW